MNKKILLSVATLIAATLATVNSANAQGAQEFVVGPKVSIYARWQGLAGVGAFARYGLTDNIRVEPAFVILCRKGAAVDISADVHYAFNLSDDFEIYPIAGLSFNKAYVASLGLNLGAGASYSISNRVSVHTDLKYMFESASRSRNPIIFSFGTGYRF